MKALAAIHVAKKQLRLEEDDYRAILLRVTGNASSKDMSEGERGAVLAELRRLGFSNSPLSGSRTSTPQGGSVPRARTGRRKLEGKYAGKLQALWISAWNLGITRSRDDKALLAFVKRQTGIDHVRFLRHGEDAAKAIEALKGWIAREAGVAWSIHNGEKWLAKPGGKIASTQWRILTGKAGNEYGSRFAGEVDRIIGRRTITLDDVTAAEWHIVMNTLGARIRKLAA